jgi:magnesium transporter
MQRIIKTPQQAGFTWIDIENPTEEELKNLQLNYNLHPAALQDVLQPEHLPKIEMFDDTAFIICRFFDDEAQPPLDSIQKISRKLAIFYRKDLVLTIHRKPLKAYQQLIDRYETAFTLNAFELTCKIVKTVLISYEVPCQKIETEIDFYENRIFMKKRIPDLIKSLYEIKRRIYIIRKISNLTHDLVVHLGSHIETHKSKPIYQDLKDYYTKVDTVIESNYDDIHNLLNIYISLSSQRTNEVMRTLTVFTAFFLPTTFVVGLYGMNFEFMPELHYTWGYPAVIGLMLFITIIIYAWFKRKGWM